MRLVTRLALTAALGVAAPVSFVAQPALAQALKPAVGNPLAEASKLARAGNTSAAIARVNEARAAATTPAERAKVAQMAAFVYTQGRQYAAAARELEQAGAGPAQLAPLYYQAGQYDKAIAAAKRAGGPNMQVIIAQSYLKQNKAADAAKVYEQLIKANGPRENWLQNLAGAYYQAGDKQNYLRTIQQVIRLDPSPERWRALLLDLKKQDMPREAKLALYQLMRETGNLTQPADVQEFAKLAIINNQPGVAKRALDEAVAAKVIAPNDAPTLRLIEAANKRASEAQASVAKLPKNAAGLMTAGHTYMGAGDYPRAVTAYNQALANNAPNPDQARLLLGISQIRAGQSAAARKTFQALPENSPFKEVAQLWDLYAATKA